MGSRQAVPIIPSMGDLRTFTKVPKIIGLVLSLSAAKGCILIGSNLSLVQTDPFILFYSKNQTNFSGIGCSPLSNLDHQVSEPLSFSGDPV